MTNKTESGFKILEWFPEDPQDYDGYWDICWNINVGIYVIIEHEGSQRTVLAPTSFEVDKLLDNTLTELMEKFIEDEVKSGDWDDFFYDRIKDEDEWNEKYGHLD